MAEGINEMVHGHISVKKKAMACIAEFGKGNFDAPLEKFPGKKAFINENIERLRTNLKKFIAEHDPHVGRAQRRRHRCRHSAGAFRRARTAPWPTGVNEMVAGHITVKKKAMACLAEFGKGNFEAPLEKFPGKKAFINDTIEQVRANLKALITDANLLVQAAVDGKLSTRADASKHGGDFRKIVRRRECHAGRGDRAAAGCWAGARQDGWRRPYGAGESTEYAGDFGRLRTAVNAAGQPGARSHPADRGQCHRAGFRGRGTEQSQPADERQRRGNRDPGQRGFGGLRAGDQERADRGHRRRRDGRQHQGDRQEHRRGHPGGNHGGQVGGDHQRRPSASWARAAPRSAR